MAVLGTACMATSFTVGIQTAGDVQPFTLIEAGSSTVSGDVNGNGALDIQDAITILEIAEGYRKATPAALSADPNDDGVLTVSDALQVLSELSHT